jgi:hypothetical protein
VDGCFEVAVDYGWYGAIGQMCSSYCRDDWDCPLGGACFELPARRLALSQLDETSWGPLCRLDEGTACRDPAWDDAQAAGEAWPNAITAAPVSAMPQQGQLAYEMPICYARCIDDWDCATGFDCIDVVRMPFFESICLPR